MANTNAKKKLTPRDIPADPVSRRGFHERRRRLDVPKVERMIRRDPRLAHDLTVWDFLIGHAGVSPNAARHYRKGYEADGVCWVSPSSVIAIMAALDLSDPKEIMIAARERLG